MYTIGGTPRWEWWGWVDPWSTGLIPLTTLPGGGSLIAKVHCICDRFRASTFQPDTLSEIKLLVHVPGRGKIVKLLGGYIIPIPTRVYPGASQGQC